jgi:hypothetical protein
MKSFAHAQAIRERRMAFLMFSRFGTKTMELRPFGIKRKAR